MATALADASRAPFWLDDPTRPAPREPLPDDTDCDLLVVGGGYSGLWTALLAKERDPARDVVLIDADRIGNAASGRNGGFCAASLTHGLANGLRRWPDELAQLERLGTANLQAIEDAVARYGIDCDWERTGSLDVATTPHQVADLREQAKTAAKYGGAVEFLDADALRAEVVSPTFHAGVWDRRSTALVNPARLAWGLADACNRLGVRIFEHTAATALRSNGAGVRACTAHGRIDARRVALGTNVFPSLLRRVRPYIVPVYDFAVVTEPLTEAQRAAIGWHNRQGMSDSGNQFHYYRQTSDHRILWGGYDAVYHYGGRLRPEYEHREATFTKLANQFFETFPQLEGLRFSHAWGGAVDTCTRFSAFFGKAHRGRVAYAAGYTGLGVGATRFGAEVMLDLLDGRPTERTQTRMVGSRPLPFPPEPLRWAGVELTRRSMIRADADGGRRNLWLRTMDRIGFGFDS
ncbi:NAD(P)/FAD-dependent oxidoreductase [Dactylosporangium sp. CA-233914]|uniref:NAD(P)/FAD-dependent oxidoreductase n=1 Tax=Dactylosporangium sp. CA-233914 TaxID=3239934 RepID=UPI003D949453